MDSIEYKNLRFLEMMIDMKLLNCEKCGDTPSFPDKWYVLPSIESVGCPVICPTCRDKNDIQE